MAITGATESGNTVTVTTSLPFPFAANAVGNEIVTIAGASAIGYNGSFTVTGISGNTFTYVNGISSLPSAVGGTVTGAYLYPTGVDLNVTAAIVDGTGYRSGGIVKAGFGVLEFSGTSSNTYTGTTTVNEGTLLLNKSDGLEPKHGRRRKPLCAGHVRPAHCRRRQHPERLPVSDLVRYLQDNQLPDYQALVYINDTGLLDLNNHSDAIGTADAQVALDDAGAIWTGTGTLTVNGNISTWPGKATWANFDGQASLPPIFAPVIAGNLNLGSGYARTIDIQDRQELQVDAIIANLLGSADLFKVDSGDLLLTGNNSGFTGTFSINGNPGYNEPLVTVGSSTVLGTGVVYPVSTVQLGAPAARSRSPTASRSSISAFRKPTT